MACMRRVCDAAVAVLREREQPGVMYGDEALCHAIADILGWEHEGSRTSRRVLAALARTPGVLAKRAYWLPPGKLGGGRWVRYFALRDCVA